ncbi:Uncharacterised protein [Klebsiella michiganensis]|nr:Uncharacterised protein [Klebsiella michiganensis]
MTDKLRLHAGQRIRQLKTDIAQQLLRRIVAGEHVTKALHPRQHQRSAMFTAAFIATQIQMLADILALRVQALQFVDQLGGIHKAKINALPRQRMNGMGGIADQRQTMGGKLTRIAAGEREDLALALHGA